MLLTWWAAAVIGAYAPVDGVQWSCSEGTGRGRIDAVVGAGALHEKDSPGVAHLLEHLLFRKGNFAYRHENGKTAFDYTHYYRVVPQPELTAAAESLLKELTSPTFTAVDVDVERKVVIKELEERGLARSSGTDPLFRGTKLDRSPGGTAPQVERLVLADILHFHRQHYGRDNVAVRIVNAPDCEALLDHLRPVLKDWPTGVAAVVPKVSTEDEPGRVPIPSATYTQGYYWYRATPEERLLWVAVGEYLRLSAFRNLRQGQGLVYTPKMTVQHMGPGGLMAVEMDVKDRGVLVDEWFNTSIDTLTEAPNLKQQLDEAFEQVGQWLDEHPEVSALAAIRGEVPPRQLLRQLQETVDREQLRRMLVENRRFGSQVSERNIASLVILGLFGAAVLAVVLYAGRQILEA